MKKSIKNVAVLFSLVFTLVLAAGVTTVGHAADPDAGVAPASDVEYDNAVQY